MRHVALVLLLLLFVITGGLFMGWVWYALTGRPTQRTKEMNKYLSWAGLTIGPRARARLALHFARRSKCGAVAGGTAFALSLPLASAVQGGSGDVSGPLAGACCFVGFLLGRAASGLSLPEPTGTARVSSLQPHGLTDYLRRREIGVEIGFTVLGVAACLAGGTALVGHDWQLATAWLAVVLGAFVGAVSAAALLLQRRLLASPLRADDEDLLVVKDIILALGLRDLLVAAVVAPLFAWYIVLTWLDLAWWQGLGYFAGICVLLLLIRPLPLAARTPVASALVGVGGPEMQCPEGDLARRGKPSATS